MTFLSRLATILGGLLLIAVIAPLSQFLASMTVNVDVETATPVGWAVGMVFAFVLVLAAVRIASRSRLVSKPNLVLLYCMLTIAVPVMNQGLVRQMFLSARAVYKEYLDHGNSTYQTAYDARRAEWFPVVPTPEGLAWNKSNRLLQLLQDAAVLRKRGSASRLLADAILLEDRRLERQAPGRSVGAAGPAGAAAATQPTSKPARNAAKLLAAVQSLGVDEVERLVKMKKPAAVASLGLGEALERREAEARRASAEAAGRLPGDLADVDERELSQLPEYLAVADASSRYRVERQYWHMTAEERAELERRKAALRGRAEPLRQAVSALSAADFGKVRDALEGKYLAAFRRMDRQRYAAVRGDFVFRLTRKERKDLWGQNGREGTPNQDLLSFEKSVWHDVPDELVQARKTNETRGLAGTLDNTRTVLRRLPWSIWVRPMVMWGLLVSAVFLLLMCLAEWIRRKWIERENLAFPLVEIADGLIRHDSMLETSVDARSPQPRRLAFNGVFLAGFAAAFLWVSMEALGHYEFTSRVYDVSFNVSANIFTSDPFRQMDKVFLVLSPIAIGIAFLVSLEVSFSVWAVFFLYSFVVWIGRLSGSADVQAAYAGYGGGSNYPFTTEQLLGAATCFAAVALYKTFRGGSAGAQPLQQHSPFVPRPLQVAGLIVLPVVIFALFWHMGMHGWRGMLFLGIVSAFVMAQTIAAARVRAETGLYTQHVSYEFTKFPMVFGLTGLTGAKMYTVYISAAFLPISLLFRSLPQHLENMELARRHRMGYRLIAVAGLAAFLVALTVGMLSFIIQAHYVGDRFWGMWTVYPGQGATPMGVANYPMWVSHFTGQESLGRYTHPMGARVAFVAVGFGVFALLAFLRGRFMRFPLHPLGYILLLFSVFFLYVSPYHKGGEGVLPDTSWLWGSALAAWAVKKLAIKYGGMNAYKRAKPFFIGLVVGAVVCVFAWNMLDLVCSLAGEYSQQPGSFIKHFLDKRPFSPRYY